MAREKKVREERMPRTDYAGRHTGIATLGKKKTVGDSNQIRPRHCGGSNPKRKMSLPGEDGKRGGTRRRRRFLVLRLNRRNHGDYRE